MIGTWSMLLVGAIAQVATPQTGPAPAKGHQDSASGGEGVFRPPAIYGDAPPVHGYRPSYSINSGYVADQIVPYPFQFGLPDPAPGLVWIRSYNDAVLLDPSRSAVIEVRPRWFGP